MTGPWLDRFDWERLIRELDLPPTVKLVAFTLATYANSDGTKVYPGRSVLARTTGLHAVTVTRAMSQLEAAGLIRVAGPRGGTRGMPRGHATMYELSTPDNGQWPTV